MKHVLDFEDFKACIAARGIALEMSDNYLFEYRTKEIHQSLDAKEFDITKALSKRNTAVDRGRYRQKMMSNDGDK